MCIRITISTCNSHKKDVEPLPSENALLYEYQTAQDFALRSFTIGWQISSILIGAVVLAFGEVINFFIDKNFDSVFLLIFLINLILSFWILIYLVQHQMYLMKLYRVRKIEKELGLQSNYYWQLGRDGGKRGIYRIYGPSEVVYTKILFIILFLFSVAYGLYVLCFSKEFYSIRIALLILSLLFPLIALVLGLFYGKKLREYIETNP